LSSNLLAFVRSAVSKPSVNQPVDRGEQIVRLRRSCSAHRRVRLVAGAQSPHPVPPSLSQTRDVDLI
jgi:hypothetical protein